MSIPVAPFPCWYLVVSVIWSLKSIICVQWHMTYNIWWRRMLNVMFLPAVCMSSLTSCLLYRQFAHFSVVLFAFLCLKFLFWIKYFIRCEFWKHFFLHCDLLSHSFKNKSILKQIHIKHTHINKVPIFNTYIYWVTFKTYFSSQTLITSLW